MSSTVWLVRHAHRLDFVQPEWFETAPYPYDPPLSAFGWQQSLELVSLLGEANIQQIFTSPYLRTLQTAYPLAQTIGLPIQVETGLREWLNPNWSAGLPTTLTLKDLSEQIPGVDLQYRPKVTPAYPETAAELAIRTSEIANKLIIQSNQSVLIVAHKYSLTGIVAALTGDESQAQQLELAPAGLVILTSEQRTMGSWQLSSLSRLC